MKRARFHSFISKVTKNQRGFTFIELIIAIAITTLITGGIVSALFQVYNVNTLNSNHMTATRQVQNAGFWISQDSQMAQIVDTTDDVGTAEIEILFLSWTGWGYDIGDDKGTDYVEVGYYYDAATSEIWRNEVKTTETYNDNGQLIDTTISSSLIRVAQFITSAITTLSPNNNKVEIKLTIVAEVGDSSEQRTYEVSPRPIG
jgi:prepilin-type N-terminal cleavage/methylation domain-containing protein